MLYPLILISLVSIFVAIWLTRRLGLLDSPDARKQHAGEVPLAGGIAIFLTVMAGTFILGIHPITHSMLAIAFILFAIGVYDDYSHLNPVARLLLEYAAGILLAIFGGVAIHNVGNLLALGDIPLLWLSVPLTALSVAGLCNAYNMIDGINGLAGATIGLPLLVLYLLAHSAGHPYANSLLALLVPLAVFLAFNLGPNTAWLPRIFLGDGGSVTLGFLVTACLVFFSQGENAVILPVTALWLVTVPLMDMLSTMLRRWKNGRSLMEADRLHMHHILMDMGLGARQTLAVMMVYAVACAMVGLALEQIPEYLSLLAYFLLFLSHCLFVMKSSALTNRLNTTRAGSR